MTHNKAFGAIQNNDINNILCCCSGSEITPEEYREAVNHGSGRGNLGK